MRRLVVPAVPLLAAALLTASQAASVEPPRPQQMNSLREAITKIVADWRVPGMAVAVVADGEVILNEGFGVRELGRPGTVTPDTLFSIGSCTKSFTAAAIGLLVEDGRLGWDDAAARYLPGFAMPDPAVTDRITIRDLLAHRTGLAGGDLISWGSTFSRQEIVERIRFLEPASGVRAGFHYNNNVYVAAGEVIPSVTGRSWDDVVSDRLLTPLGMARTVTGVGEIPAGADRSTPHADLGGRLEPIPPMNEDNCAAAGALWSSAADMTRWIRMLLAGGILDGRRVVAAETLAELWRMQIPLPTDDDYDAEPAELRPRFAGYGLGWFLRDYRGRKVVSHGGQSDGMVAQVTLIPEQGIGLVILLNRHESDAFEPVAHLILDAMLDVPNPPDWNRLFLEAERGVDRSEPAAAASPGPVPPIESDPGLLGRYSNPAVGDAEIALEAGSIVLLLDRTPLYGGRLEPAVGGGLAVQRDYPLVQASPIRFQRDGSGRVTGFTLEPDETRWLASIPYHFDRIEGTTDEAGL